MKKRKYIGVIYLLLIFVSCSIERDEKDQLYRDLIDKVGEAIQYEIKDKDLNAISIAIIKQDAFFWAEGFGFIDKEKKIKADKITI